MINKDQIGLLRKIARSYRSKWPDIKVSARPNKDGKIFRQYLATNGVVVIRLTESEETSEDVGDWLADAYTLDPLPEGTGKDIPDVDGTLASAYARARLTGQQRGSLPWFSFELRVSEFKGALEKHRDSIASWSSYRQKLIYPQGTNKQIIAVKFDRDTHELRLHNNNCKTSCTTAVKMQEESRGIPEEIDWYIFTDHVLAILKRLDKRSNIKITLAANSTTPVKLEGEAPNKTKIEAYIMNIYQKQAVSMPVGEPETETESEAASGR